MRSLFVLFYVIVLVVYGSLQFFIGVHGWRVLKAFHLPLSPLGYGLVFGLISSSYVLSRIGNHYLPEPLYELLHWIGAYWLGAMFFLFLFFLAFDLLRALSFFLSYLLPSNPVTAFIRTEAGTRYYGAFTLLLVVSLLLHGTLQARSPRITRYQVSISKAAPASPSFNSARPLRLVFVSDIHLGTLIGKSRLERLVDKILKQEPDLVVLGGDVLDEDLGPFVEQNMSATLARLKPPLGVYAVPGNHEYIGRHLTEFSQYLDSAGIRILKDERQEIGGFLTLVGRDDLTAERFTGQKRKPLSSLLEGVDRSKPILLIDHQPFTLAEAERAGVDLQLSGHTHKGQIWPNHLITRKVYELDYGYKKKGNTHVIVSSGYGTWGPPIRIGSPPEIVVVEIQFNNP